MNLYIKSQISNMTTMGNAFKKACHLAATQDDGKINREEEKILKKLDKATDRFLKEINAVIQDNT